jgi:hypothetical protein
MKYFLPNRLLAFSIYYIYCTAIFAWAYGTEKFHWPALYYFTVISFATAICLFRDFRNFQSSLSKLTTLKINDILKMKFWPYLVCGLGIYALFRWQGYQNYSIWFDETTQFFTGVFPTDRRGLTEFAAIQQQPPIDYYLSSFAREIFGVEYFSLRIHTFIFSILTLVLAIDEFYRRKFPIWIFVLWVTFYLVQAEIAQYSYEARPISMGIFFSFLTFLFLEKFKNENYKDPVPMLLSATILLFSLGYQSCIFLFCLALSESTYKSTKNVFQIWKYLAIIPGIICLPSWAYVFYKSIGENQFHSSGILETALATFEKNLLPWLGYFYDAFDGLWIFAFLAFTLLAIAAFSAKQMKGFKDTIPSILIFCISFPTLTIFTWSFINWDFLHKYFSLWAVGIFLLSFKALSFARYAASKNPKIKWFGIPIVVAIAILGYSQFLPIQKNRVNAQFKYRPNWNAFAGELNSYKTVELNFLYLTAQDQPQYDWHFLTGRMFQSEKHQWAFLKFKNGEFTLNLADENNYMDSRVQKKWMLFVNAKSIERADSLWRFTTDLAQFGRVTILADGGISVFLQSEKNLKDLLFKHFPKIQLAKKLSNEAPF